MKDSRVKSLAHLLTPLQKRFRLSLGWDLSGSMLLALTRSLTPISEGLY